MNTERLVSFLLWAVAAFVAGSIPFGLILVRLAGKGDVRQQGSGNIGATNVMRSGGKGLGILTLLLDAAKGYLPVFLAAHYMVPLRTPPDMVVLAWIGLAAVVGHMYTPWLKFEGGKGVATALGVCLAYHPMMVVPALGTFVVLVAIFRYVSLGSVAAALVLIPCALGMFGERFSGIPSLAFQFGDMRYLLLAWVLLCGLVVRKHAANLQRLLKGTESKLFAKKTGA